MNLKKAINLLHIEIILLLISLFTFISSLYIKNQAYSHFEKLNSRMENLQIQFRQLSLEDRKNISKELREDYFSITYFNKNISDSLNDLINIFTKNEDSFELYENFLESSISFSNLISQHKNKLDFGYQALILTSFFLIFLTLFLFFYKGNLAKNELLKIKNTNEEHLKFSRDLHDGAAQDIAALRLYLEQGDNEKSKQFADQAFKEIRYLIDSLHLDLTKDFKTIVEEMLNAFQTNYKIEA